MCSRYNAVIFDIWIYSLLVISTEKHFSNNDEGFMFADTILTTWLWLHGFGYIFLLFLLTPHHVDSKLMQFNRTQAKFCVESDFNCHLIDIFDPNLSPSLIQIVPTIQIQTRISNLNSNMNNNIPNLIKNLSNLIKNDQKSLNLYIIVNIFDRIWPFPMN